MGSASFLKFSNIDKSVDVIKFTDVGSTDLTQIGYDNGYNLIFAYGTNSSLMINNYFSGAFPHVDQLQFSYCVIWDWSIIKQKVLQGLRVAANGTNSGVIFSLSHAINNDIISFDEADDYAEALSLTTDNLSATFKYLQFNISAREAVAFNALGNTYVFQDREIHNTLVQFNRHHCQ